MSIRINQETRNVSIIKRQAFSKYRSIAEVRYTKIISVALFRDTKLDSKILLDRPKLLIKITS